MPEDTRPEASALSSHRMELTEKKIKGEISPFTRFFRKMTQLFSNDIRKSEIRHHQMKLSGRISELQSTSETSLKHLLAIKHWLKTAADPQTYALALSLIDPMINEALRLQKNLESKSTVATQVKLVSKYVEWIEKAHVWSELKIDQPSANQVQKVIIQQTIFEFQTRIARDVQVIQDYLNHASQEQPLKAGVKKQLEKKLVPMLSEIIKNLYALQNVSQEITLDSLMNWRSTSDDKREGYFSEALHAIDTFFMEH